MIHLPHLVIFTPKKCGTFTVHAAVDRVHVKGLWSDEIRKRPLPISVVTKPWHRRTLPIRTRTPDCLYLMLDRDPLDRFMSQYFFAKKMKEQGSSCWNGAYAELGFEQWCEEFFKARDSINWVEDRDYLKYGGNWTDFVLTQEEYYDFILEPFDDPERVKRVHVSNLFTTLKHLFDPTRLDEAEVACNKHLNKAKRDRETSNLLDSLPTHLQERIAEWTLPQYSLAKM